MKSSLNSMDCRCACGALMARRTPAGVELKCRRCKRVWSLALEDAAWKEAFVRPEALAPRATT